MQVITINMNEVVFTYRSKLQRELDIVHFTYSCIDSYNYESYKKVKLFSTFMPAKEVEMTPTVAKDASKEKALISFLVDCVNLTAGFLEDCYRICNWLRIGNCDLIDQATADRFNRSNEKFHKAGFPKKFSDLRNEFTITTEFESYFQSFNAARNCLVHRNGIVTEKDIDSSGLLNIKTRYLQLFQSSPDGHEQTPLNIDNSTNIGWSVCIKPEDVSTIFRVGEQVTFSIEMLSKVSFTLYMMADDIIQSVAAYGKSRLA